MSVLRRQIGFCAEDSMAELHLGTAQVHIAPPLGVSLAGSFADRKATDIHDDLHVKTLVIGSGDVKFAIAVCDLILIIRQDTDAAKAMIAEECGIPPENVLLAATHTHSGPAPEAGEMMIESAVRQLSQLKG